MEIRRFSVGLLGSTRMLDGQVTAHHHLIPIGEPATQRTKIENANL